MNKFRHFRRFNHRPHTRRKGSEALRGSKLSSSRCAAAAKSVHILFRQLVTVRSSMVQSLRRRHVRGACRSRTQLTAPPPQLGTLAAKVKPRSGSSNFHVRAESSRSRASFANTSQSARRATLTHKRVEPVALTKVERVSRACAKAGFRAAWFPHNRHASHLQIHICIVVHWHVAYICARVLRAHVHA